MVFRPKCNLCMLRAFLAEPCDQRGCFFEALLFSMLNQHGLPCDVDEVSVHNAECRHRMLLPIKI